MSGRLTALAVHELKRRVAELADAGEEAGGAVRCRLGVALAAAEARNRVLNKVVGPPVLPPLAEIRARL